MIERNIYKLFRYACILAILIFPYQSVSCQENAKDSIPQTDSIPLNDSLLNYHSPRKAVLFSALIPGLGQIYNKKYWKVPIIYATFGVLAYFIAYNNRYYVYFKGADIYYQKEQLGKPVFIPVNTNGGYVYFTKLPFKEVYPDLQYLSDPSLESGMNTYRRWRDLNALGFLAFYIFQIIDANVDAHFFNYDISQDISLNVHPGIVINDNLMGYVVGLKINVHF